MAAPRAPSPTWGCVDYQSPHTVLSDRFSPLALGVSDFDGLGVKELFMKALHEASGRPLLSPLARLFVKVKGDWEPCRLLRREGHPAGWRARGECSLGPVEEEVHFVSAGQIRLRWRLAEGGAAQFAILGGVGGGGVAARLGGRVGPAGLEVKFGIEFTNVFMGGPAGRLSARARLETPRGWARGGFFSPRGALSLPPGAAETPRATAAGGASAWWLESRRVEACVLDVHFDFGAGESPEPRPAETLDAAVARWEEDFARLPAPREVSPYWRGQLARALGTITGSALRAPGYGNFADELGIPAAGKTWASTAFFWDHFMAATVLGVIRPEWQESATRFFLRHCAGGRMAPGILLAWPRYRRADHFLDCYAPVVSWSILLTAQATGREPDWAKLYPLLSALHRAWQTHCDRDGDGIPEWRNTGNPADNSPLYDRYAPKEGAFNFAVPPFVSVNLCSYLLMDARCLAKIARRLGDKSGATEWDQRGDHLERVLLERCWDPEAGFFFDLTPEGQRNPVRTFFGFLPLWAGVRLPTADARRLIEGHLLSPRSFFGAVPFPSVAYDEKGYDPSGYWRGRTWPHVYFWLTQTLWSHGYHAEAETARERFLRITAAQPQPMENAASQVSHLAHQGVPNYVWGASALAHFLWDWHRLPVLPAASSPVARVGRRPTASPLSGLKLKSPTPSQL